MKKYALKACFFHSSILLKKCKTFVVSKPVLPEVGIPPTSSVFLKKMQKKSFIEDFLRRPHPARPHMDTPCTSTHGYTLHVHTWIHPARPHMDTTYFPHCWRCSYIHPTRPRRRGCREIHPHTSCTSLHRKQRHRFLVVVCVRPASAFQRQLCNENPLYVFLFWE